MTTAYQQLEAHYRQIGLLGGANALLFWDRNVVMPPAAAPSHAAISGAMAAVIAEKQRDPQLGDLFASAESAAGSLDDWQRANLKEMRRQHRHATAGPAALLARKAALTAALNPVWQQARAQNDFAAFAPGLDEVIQLQRELAAHKAQALGLSPYDALMDESDPGVTCELVDRVFGVLAKELPPLLAQIEERQASWKPLPLKGPFPVERQRDLCETVMRSIGYDFTSGRLDPTAHPFAIPGVAGDCRITTRFRDDDWRFGLLATIHETGHSFYEYHLPRAWAFQPAGCARGATLHESQSLMLEMQACRSAEFVEFVAPLFADRFGADDRAWSADNLRLYFHRIQRNFIRVEADEVVYPLHVILRYELERQLLEGKLATRDIPEAWNARMKSLIGVVPPTDTLGCLQDVHWSFGMFGYFPNYALGAATAAQLFEAATTQDTSILPSIARGDFAPYFRWVKPRVHELASSRPAAEIIEGATGAPLQADALLRHLRRRYL